MGLSGSKILVQKFFIGVYAMPVLTDWPVDLSVEDVFRIQHANIEIIRQRRPGIVEMTERGVRQAAGLVHPVVVYQTVAVDRIESGGVFLAGGFQLTGSFLARQLAGAEEVAVVVCTIGCEVENYASTLMTENKHVEGYAVDSAGIVAIGQIADRFYSNLEVEANSNGKQTSYRFSPGLPEWSVTQGQPEIFSILENVNSAVQLCASMQMFPVKSLSYVVGIGKDLVRKGNECAYCGMRDRCTFRKEHDAHLAGDTCHRRSKAEVLK